MTRPATFLLARPSDLNPRPLIWFATLTGVILFGWAQAVGAGASFWLVAATCLPGVIRVLMRQGVPQRG